MFVGLTYSEVGVEEELEDEDGEEDDKEIVPNDADSFLLGCAWIVTGLVVGVKGRDLSPSSSSSTAETDAVLFT
jgi:hypothetical protein